MSWNSKKKNIYPNKIIQIIVPQSCSDMQRFIFMPLVLMVHLGHVVFGSPVCLFESLSKSESCICCDRSAIFPPPPISADRRVTWQGPRAVLVSSQTGRGPVGNLSSINPVVWYYAGFKVCTKTSWVQLIWSSQRSQVKAGPLRLKQLANTLNIKILSQPSILYLIRHASVILIVGLNM